MTCEQWAQLGAVVLDGTDPEADYIIRQEGIDGLGLPDINTASDLVLLGGHGAVSGRDWALPRTLRVPTIIRRRDLNGNPDPQAAMESLRAFKAAWKPADDGTDRQLSTYVPGIGPADHTLVWFGRPRGTMAVSLRNLADGLIYCLPTFTAIDPIGYGAARQTSGTGAVTVNNAGDAASRRYTITLTGNGGTPSIVNASDDGASILFEQPLGGGTTWVIDVAEQTVVNGAGVDAFWNNVLSSSQWPRLVPGDNSFTVSGVGGAVFDHRDAWW